MNIKTRAIMFAKTIKEAAIKVARRKFLEKSKDIFSSVEIIEVKNLDKGLFKIHFVCKKEEGSTEVRPLKISKKEIVLEHMDESFARMAELREFL